MTYSIMIPLIKPYITNEVKEEVARVLDSGYLTEGPVTEQFEEAFRQYIGCGNAIAVSNCTVGLEMALRALKIGPGDEVIVPDYTYPATASVVNIVSATAVLVDVNPETMLIDYEALEAAITERTRAVIPVSLFGNPLDWERLNQIKEKYGLYIVEDAACSIGAEYKGTKMGNLADISVFSLHPRKFITTCEGGMITTNHSGWSEWMLSYKHFGIGKNDSRADTCFDRIGTNYKLSNLQAAIGLVQMRHIDKLLAKRRTIAEQYMNELNSYNGFTIPEVTQNGKHSYQSCCVFTDNRDHLIMRMKERGIQTQIGTYALHMHKAFNDNSSCRIDGEMAGSQYVYQHCLTLPMYHEMTENEQKTVIKNLKEITLCAG